MFDLKELISTLFANREEEGITNLKSATRMVEQLPENQVIEAVTEIVKALQKMNRNPRISVKERFRTIAYLDEKTRPLLDHMVDVFFGRRVDTTASPRQLLLTIVAFKGEMANAYGVCLKLLAQAPRAVEPSQLQRFTLRGTMYCTALIKWSYLRYLPVKQGVWQIINRFYQFAEQQQFSAIEQSPYAGQPTTTIEREYLLILILSLSMPEKMQVAQIELVNGWLRCWEKLPVLEKEIQPNRQTFAINTAVATAPRRLQRDMIGDSWRYIDTTGLTRIMREVIAQLQQGIAPADLGLPAQSTQPYNIQLMQQLHQLWSREIPAPARRHKRQPISSAMTVICGLPAIIEQMMGTRPAKASRNNILQLLAENISESGIGAQLAPKRSEQLPIGELVALRESIGAPLKLGIVRRIVMLPDGKIFTGIEYLLKQTIQTKTALVVELTPVNKPSLLAIYSPDASADNRFLLLPQSEYQQGGEYQLSAQGKGYVIQLQAALEYTPETVRAGFTVLNKVDV